MRIASCTAVLSALLIFATGCGHKAKVNQSARMQAPPPPMSRMVHLPALPDLPPPVLHEVVLGKQERNAPAPSTHSRRTTHRRPSSHTVDTATVQAPDKSTTPPQTAAVPAPEISPIGQLSSTGDGSNPQGRHDIEQLISSTERGLSNIKRTLTPEEQTTSSQIKTFLTRAKQALSVDDMEGARTLATKARVLLTELSRK